MYGRIFAYQEQGLELTPHIWKKKNEEEEEEEDKRKEEEEKRNRRSRTMQRRPTM